MSTILPRHIARHAATLLAAITFTAIIAAPTTSAWADDSQNAKETACTKAVTAINDAVSAAVSSYVDQHALTKEAFAALPAADDAPQAFALAGDETPNLSSDGLAQIQSASAFSS